MLMRNSNTGDFELYDISNNAITFAAPMGQVGLEWSVAGFGDFSGSAPARPATCSCATAFDRTIRGLRHQQQRDHLRPGWVRSGWNGRWPALATFSGNANETDMLMRNSNTGAFELYDISNNAITFAGPMGQVGLEWSGRWLRSDRRRRPSDMLMRNTNTGAFEIFDIANNQLTTAAADGPSRHWNGRSPVSPPIRRVAPVPNWYRRWPHMRPPAARLPYPRRSIKRP